ncbi:MAG TPA: hypothetical protein VJS92_17050 [Candidatus Polarisedimenticolaceae bacterium]|nr:hypothetical protein [Candidatus Polarisedimenticolaceae bacterium]
MKTKLVRAALVGAILTLAALGSKPVSIASSNATSIRFCCTPQQVQACSAQGGTASCRTNVCQCLF